MEPLVAIALWALLLPALWSAATKDKPALLFCSPQGPAYGWIDLSYLGERYRQGFELYDIESRTDGDEIEFNVGQDPEVIFDLFKQPAWRDAI